MDKVQEFHAVERQIHHHCRHHKGRDRAATPGTRIGADAPWMDGQSAFWPIPHASSAWGVLHEAQRHHRLATTGRYARIRHPQYAALVIIMFGFLLQWPTFITLVMFPILVWEYAPLALSEERDLSAEFGNEYAQYRHHTPAFIPTFTRERIAQ